MLLIENPAVCISECLIDFLTNCVDCNSLECSSSGWFVGRLLRVCCIFADFLLTLSSPPSFDHYSSPHPFSCHVFSKLLMTIFVGAVLGQKSTLSPKITTVTHTVTPANIINVSVFLKYNKDTLHP